MIFADSKPVRLRCDDLKECNTTAQKQLQTSKGYVFGPFTPVRLPKREENVREKGVEVRNWETLASSFRPEYHNQGLFHSKTASHQPKFVAVYAKVVNFP